MKLIKYIFISAFLILFSIDPSCAYEHRAKDNYGFDQQVRCVAQHLNGKEDMNWQDVCFFDPNTDPDQLKRRAVISDALDRVQTSIKRVQSGPVELPHPYRYRQTDFNKEKTRKAIRSQVTSDLTSEYNNHALPRSQYNFAYEMYSYTYREPDLMRLRGLKNGVSGGYTHRFSYHDNIHSFKDATNDIMPNVAKIEGQIGWGKVDYESEGSGSNDSIKDVSYDFRGIAGYDVPLRQNLTVTPFVGLGFRYLINKSTGKDTYVEPILYKAYDRESRYFYAPLGLEFAKEFDKNWHVNLILEYDLFFNGRQKSHLEDTGILLVSADDGSIHTPDALNNDQNNGYGLRGSLKVMKRSEEVDFYLQPFVRFWDIKDSELEQWTSDNGSRVWFYNTDPPIPVLGLEPRNNTTEFGIKLGLNF